MMAFSIYTVSSPNALLASRRALLNAAAKSPALSTRRMPLPPPPAEALMSTGKPMRWAASWARVASGKPWPLGPLSPGTTGTPAAIIDPRARVLSPIIRMALAGGPMNVIPAASQASANTGFSDRNPYPGCTASASDSRHAARMRSTTR